MQCIKCGDAVGIDEDGCPSADNVGAGCSDPWLDDAKRCGRCSLLAEGYFSTEIGVTVWDSTGSDELFVCAGCVRDTDVIQSE